MRRRSTFTAVVVVAAMSLSVSAIAVPGLSEDSIATLANARSAAATSADEMLEAQGQGRGLDPDRARGLARASEVSQSWRFTGEAKPGNGPNRNEGRGSDRSQQVHEALAAGLSPSAVHNPDIDKPGRELEQAFNRFQAKRDGHPGKGEGKGLGGPGGTDDD